MEDISPLKQHDIVMIADVRYLKDNNVADISYEYGVVIWAYDSFVEIMPITKDIILTHSDIIISGEKFGECFIVFNTHNIKTPDNFTEYVRNKPFNDSSEVIIMPLTIDNKIITLGEFEPLTVKDAPSTSVSETIDDLMDKAMETDVKPRLKNSFYWPSLITGLGLGILISSVAYLVFSLNVLD